jgi:hypothetical protein
MDYSKEKSIYASDLKQTKLCIFEKKNSID